MSISRYIKQHKLLIIPPVAIGILVFFLMTTGKQPPAKIENAERETKVRVIEAPMIKLIPVAEGYGQVRPARVWTAIAQVAGRIMEIHPKLRNGEILPEGAILVRIDATDYELSVSKAKAELAELEVQEKNARASLAIEERNLSLASKDMQRKQSLLKKGTVSQSSVDDAERVMLSKDSTVQNLRNTLALIPTQRRVLEAKVDGALRDIERTEVRAPFTMRIAALSVEAEQYVGLGKSMFEGDDISRIEVNSQLALSTLRNLFIGRKDIVLDVAKMSEQVSANIGIDPLVRLDMGNHIAEWQGEFVRFSDTVDPETRTMGVVVAVDKPFEKIKPGYRPPLSKGMFVQVVLRGRRQQARIVIPRNAIRNNNVHVADQDNRLLKKPVEILFNQGSYSVIAKGLEQGERVLLSDPVPAVTGMLLRPEVDQDVTNQLHAAGSGAGT
ncbi:MAG: efflux RND transporter periplasmic adaptor subunit [Gammaproteobacteria bacterium]|nr:efflux RND transporter periplasmic adaptor subunit [Gammaproteobacteria bacterium]MDX2486350.1 efflux RND transporter periplasmic adaptor subunit [Gammaproteobacteria bacterium]